MNMINEASIITASTQLQKQSKQVEEDKIFGTYAKRPVDLEQIKAIENPYHTKAIHFKGVCTVGLGFSALNNKGEPIETVPDILNQANSLESFQEVINNVALDAEETGEGYLEVVRNAKNEPQELYWVPAETVLLKLDKSLFRQKVREKEAFFYPYGRKKKGGSKNYGEIIRIKYPSNRSTYYGTPNWLGAVGSILLDQYAVDWNYRFFENNAIPSFAVIVEGGEFSPEVEAKIKDFLKQNYKGLDNAHKTLLLPIKNKDVKVKFEEIMKRPREGEFTKLRDQLRNDIISAHGVPPRLVGVITSGSLGGGGEAQQQLRIFKEISINPRQTLFESVINRTLGKDLNFQIKFNEIDVTPEKDDIEELVSLVTANIVEQDEAREQLGYKLNTSKSSTKEEEALRLIDQIVSLRELLSKKID